MRRKIEVEVGWHCERVVEESSSEVSSSDYGILCLSIVVEQDRVKLSAVLIRKIVDSKIEVAIVAGVDELVESLIYDVMLALYPNMSYKVLKASLKLRTISKSPTKVKRKRIRDLRRLRQAEIRQRGWRVCIVGIWIFWSRGSW